MKTKTKPVVSTTTLARMGVASSWGGVRPKRYNGQPEIAPEKEKQKKNRRKTPLAFTRREQSTKQKTNHQRK